MAESNDDPIMAEIRAAKERVAEKYGNDVRAIGEALQAREKDTVDLSKPPARPGDDSSASGDAA